MYPRVAAAPNDANSIPRDQNLSLHILWSDSPLHTQTRRAFASDLTDRPFIELKEVLGSYWLVEANSIKELAKWALKCPAEAGDVIEIR